MHTAIRTLSNAPAPTSPPTLDIGSSAVATANLATSTSSYSLGMSSLVTTGPDEIIVLSVVTYSRGSVSSVTSISGTSLTWNQRSVRSSGSADAYGYYRTIETWWAPCIQPTTSTITINANRSTSGSLIYMAAIGFAVVGVHMQEPFDPDPSLAQFSENLTNIASIVQAQPISTDYNDVFVFSTVATGQNDAMRANAMSPIAPTPTTIATTYNGLNANEIALQVAYGELTAGLHSTTIAYDQSTSGLADTTEWLLGWDALRA